MKLAQEELMKKQIRYKKNYDKKTKDRLFNEGDRFLVMFPTNNNKLLMQWKGPYKIIQKMGDHDYKILVGNKENNYHVNMLKNYYVREDEAKTGNEKEDLKIAASAKMLLDEEIRSIHEDLLLELGTYKQKEDVSHVKLGMELDDSQSRQLQALIENYNNVFSDVPGRTSKIEHRINLVDGACPLKTLSFTICAAAGTERRNKGDVRYGDHQKVIIAVCFTGSYYEEEEWFESYLRRQQKIK